MNQKFVSVVLPCLNEQPTISRCIEKIKSVLRANAINGEIIVVDNGSNDGSAEIARALGVKVLHQNVRGYGAAYLLGFNEAKGETIVMADSDGTYDFSEIPSLLSPIDSGSADFVIGSRFKGKIAPGAMKPLHQFIGNPLLTFVFNLFFSSSLSDTHSGFRAFKKSFLEKAEFRQLGMQFALEMLVNAKKQKLEISEVPITYSARSGVSKMNSLRDGLKHFFFILGARFS
ncbi:MAG: glycosyltransferase family 2 protein [Candidatus Diapherotrites archaeon]